MTHFLPTAAALIGLTAYQVLGTSSTIPLVSPLLLLMCLYNLGAILLQKKLLQAVTKRAPELLQAANPKNAIRLHASAIALAAGAVAGMYWDGLFRAYEAQWQSTFLNEWGMNALIHTFFSLPALLTGLTIPEIANLQKPGSGPGAPWVHLHAAAAVLYIGVPRALMILTLAWPKPKITAKPRPGKIQGLIGAEIHPAATKIEGGARDKLQAAFQDIAGISPDFKEKIPYNSANPCPAITPGHCIILVFPLERTPEQETDGQLARNCIRQAKKNTRIAAIVDSSNWRSKDPVRTKNQKGLWERLLAGENIPTVHANLNTESTERIAEKLRSALQPEEGLV